MSNIQELLKDASELVWWVEKAKECEESEEVVPKNEGIVEVEGFLGKETIRTWLADGDLVKEWT